MTTTTAELTGEYTIDTDHSRVGFVARHAMVTKVRGSFNEWGGGILVSEKITLEIEVSAIKTA